MILEFVPPVCITYEGRTVGERIRDFVCAGIDPEFTDVPAAYDSRRDLENFIVDPDCDYGSTRLSLVSPNGDDIDRAKAFNSKPTESIESRSNNAEGAES